MKKILITVGIVILVGGASAGYVYSYQIPKITINSIDWNKKRISFTIRGVKHSFTAMDNGLGTSAPIKFSKYMLSFSPNQSNTNDVWRLSVEDGDVQVGKSIYFDFKNKKQS